MANQDNLAILNEDEELIEELISVVNSFSKRVVTFGNVVEVARETFELLTEEINEMAYHIQDLELKLEELNESA